MTQARFKEIIENYIIYLYPNLNIKSEVDFLDQVYAKLDDQGNIIIKGDIHATKGFIISIDQPFLPNDEMLLSNFISEINNIESYTSLKEEYIETLISTALNNAISSTLSSKSNETISSVINALSKYSNRTYEGKNITYGVIVNDKLNCQNRTDNLEFSEYIDNYFSAVLTNGTSSFIEIDSDGFIIKHIQLSAENNEIGFAPFDYTRILEYAGKDSTGIVLSRESEILIFHNNELKYTKRGDRWNPYSHKETIKLIHDKSENDNLLFARSVYLTALDVSFGKTGGIIAFLNENEIENALYHVDINDIVNDKYYELKKKELKLNGSPQFSEIENLSFEEFLRKEEAAKSCICNKLINNKKFFQLARKFREELVSIDGATIIDYNGDIVAVGAIVKIEAGSIGGGRLAAAKTMSQYGIAIDISSDSSIKCFAANETGVSESIFTISDFA